METGFGELQKIESPFLLHVLKVRADQPMAHCLAPDSHSSISRQPPVSTDS
jgi:hypothetical protein